jgi:hypothetical protein
MSVKGLKKRPLLCYVAIEKQLVSETRRDKVAIGNEFKTLQGATAHVLAEH